eukprot:7391684-Prymnesium_polylepis.1
MGYNKIATVNSDDSYGAGGVESFRAAAAAVGMTVLVSVSIANDQREFSAQINDLKRSNARIIVIFTQARDSGPFLRTAYQSGVGGPGFLWFGGNAVVNTDTWETDVGGMAEDLTLRLNVMKGFFGMSPSRGVGSALYTAYLSRLRALPDKSSVNGTCNMETDDDGGRTIWAQDHDDNASTPIVCSGSDNQADDSWAPFAYDATYALAHALHELIEVQGKTSIVGSELLDALITRVSFDGVTGRVEFYDASSHPDKLYNGDRRVGAAYDVVNYQRNSGDLSMVGRWVPGGDTWLERWTDHTRDNASYAPMVYSTEDNSRPPDVPESGVGVVRVGALFPIFKTAAAGYGLDGSGVRRFTSFYLALKEINDKTDGVADNLLPNTQLLFAFRDSKRSSGTAFLGALDLANEVFNKEGVSGILGAASSGPSSAAATISSQFMVPQI